MDRSESMNVEALAAIIAEEIRDSVRADIHFDLDGVERAAEFAAHRIMALSEARAT